jgi:hypothetical protein
MATAAINVNRRRHQEQVERLLEQIRVGVQELRVLKTLGARGPALADRKSELDQARRRLARLVGADSLS